MLTDSDLAFAFQHALAREDAEIDLARASLLVAELEYPGLDVAAYVERLDGLADGFRDRGLRLDEGARFLALREHLFRELGFSGNEREYYDPRNSFLNEVLDRRLGIPISLSVLLMEVGGRLGLLIDGIAAPGHFVVRFQGRLYDPFRRGRELAKEDTRRLVQGDPARAPAAKKRDIVARMLRNLASIYQRNSDLVRLGRIRERLAMVESPPRSISPPALA